jgi:nitric-oxide synthase, bacterial
LPLQFQIPILTRRKVANEGRHFSEREQELLKEAYSYLLLFHQEHRTPELFAGRYAEVRVSIERSGNYKHTYEELEYGARVAWRNSSRCIGRLHWQSLTVRDLRHLSSAEDIFEALLDHIRFATNGGKIRSTISVFAHQEPGQPGIRIWNPQLIRYAGFRQPGGRVLGDPLHAELTQVARELGWRPERESPFTVIPLVIQMPGQQPKLFKLPSDAVLEVPLSHPDYTWFARLGLKWHALPVISNMRMEIGGLSYTAAPFNGYYMGTEVGARNLGDEGRYNLLPVIAERMGLNTRSDRTLWKDRALVELNVAVLHSFAQHGVTIVDHHTASRQFIHHGQKEMQSGRPLPADWGWIVPPISGSATPVFHIPYRDVLYKPNFFYQTSPWRDSRQDGAC